MHWKYVKTIVLTKRNTKSESKSQWARHFVLSQVVHFWDLQVCLPYCRISQKFAYMRNGNATHYEKEDHRRRIWRKRKKRPPELIIYRVLMFSHFTPELEVVFCGRCCKQQQRIYGKQKESRRKREGERATRKRRKKNVYSQCTIIFSLEHTKFRFGDIEYVQFYQVSELETIFYRNSSKPTWTSHDRQIYWRDTQKMPISLSVIVDSSAKYKKIKLIASTCCMRKSRMYWTVCATSPAVLSLSLYLSMQKIIFLKWTKKIFVWTFFRLFCCRSKAKQSRD